jgi:hypothetical protein
MGNYDYNTSSNKDNLNNYYAAATVTISGIVNDYSLKDNSTLFSIVTTPNEFIIRNRDEDISVKLNSIDNDLIYIGVDSDFGLQNIIVSDIFVDTVASGVSIFDVVTLGWK